MESRGRISAGWSFTAGTFFGAFAVFAVPAALHNSSAGAGTSDLRRARTVETAASAAAPEARNFARDAGAGVTVKPVSTLPRKAKPGEPQRKLQGHSELDLQLE